MARPPVLFVHGAANGAWVWEFWRRELNALGWDANVMDLRGHGLSMPADFETTTMEDYVEDVASVTPQMVARTGQHPVIAGWSLGGLVALMYAAKHLDTPALLLFEASPPEQVQGRGSAADLVKLPIGPIGPEVYGLFPDVDLERSRPALPDLTVAEATKVLEMSRGARESGLARRQRKSGISVPAASLRAPSLVVYGDAQGRQGTNVGAENNRKLALYLGAETIAVAGASHWGLVFSEETVVATAPLVDTWLRKTLRLS